MLETSTRGIKGPGRRKRLIGEVLPRLSGRGFPFLIRKEEIEPLFLEMSQPLAVYGRVTHCGIIEYHVSSLLLSLSSFSSCTSGDSDASSWLLSSLGGGPMLH